MIPDTPSLRTSGWSTKPSRRCDRGMPPSLKHPISRINGVVRWDYQNLTYAHLFLRRRRLLVPESSAMVQLLILAEVGVT